MTTLMTLPVGLLLCVCGLAALLLRRAAPITLQGFVLLWVGLALGLSSTGDNDNAFSLLCIAIAFSVVGGALHVANFRWRGNEHVDELRSLGGR
jgi:NADH:ubiquinone oxidoreductase subunit K